MRIERLSELCAHGHSPTNPTPRIPCVNLVTVGQGAPSSMADVGDMFRNQFGYQHARHVHPPVRRGDGGATLRFFISSDIQRARTVKPGGLSFADNWRGARRPR